MCLAVVWLCYLEQDKEVQEFGEALFQKKAKNEWQAGVLSLLWLDSVTLWQIYPAKFDEWMFSCIQACYLR